MRVQRAEGVYPERSLVFEMTQWGLDRIRSSAKQKPLSLRDRGFLVPRFWRCCDFLEPLAGYALT